jgi:hypothetical protein
VTWWFSPGFPVYSINKTDRHNITEILLKVTLNTINLNQPIIYESSVLAIGIKGFQLSQDYGH